MYLFFNVVLLFPYLPRSPKCAASWLYDYYITPVYSSNGPRKQNLNSKCQPKCNQQTISSALCTPHTPPRGKRGFEALLAVDKFVQQGPEGVRELTGINYLEQADEGLVVAVQIETNGALENVHEIAGINGIDVLFIGPFDLGVNIGHPIRHPDNYDQELVDAIRTIYNAGRKAGKAVGIYSDTGVQGRAYAEQGFQMISVITDIVGLKTV
ncbi:Pyruvate/Phosphoenolpyruvate kinase-like domain-containing protein [Aspergillus oleicola]